MRAEPEHRAILALDLQGFGRLERTNLDRARMRTGLHRILRNALSAAGIAPEQIEQTEYGDGVLVLLGPQVSKARLLHPLLPRLIGGLGRYNRTAPDAGRLRVRAVVHAGELLRDAHGMTGEDLVLAFRLLDADVVRARLTQAMADLVLVVSEAMYQGIVKHGYGSIDPAVFQPVWITAKETSTRAWLYIPGADRQSTAAAPTATTHSLTTPRRSRPPVLPSPPLSGHLSPNVTPLAGRQPPETWQIPAYTYVESCHVGGFWMVISSQIASVMGHPPETAAAPGFWQSVLHPADRDRVIEATQRLEALHALSAAFRAAAFRKMRSPLASILETCRKLGHARSRLPEATSSELLGGVTSTLRQLDRLLTDVIDLQRLDWGAVTLDRRPFDIATLVQQVSARWRAQGSWPQVSVTSMTVRLDVSKVARILNELLANAMTHTPPGTPVWVRTVRHGTGILLAVEDAGRGLPAELPAAVFERFSNDRTALTHRPGPAIGLSLVLRLAELHGGTAWVQDRPGGGTSVNVILPGPPTPASSVL